MRLAITLIDCWMQMMFIAHLPAGYVCAQLSKGKIFAENRKVFFWALILGSILPDFDMFYFYLIDGRQTHHHLYWPHLPSFWIIFYAIAALLCRVFKSRKSWVGLNALCLGALTHLLLDTPFGGIAWLHPFSSQLFYLTEIPSGRSWWVWNFILHWTFGLELLICATAGWLFFVSRKYPRTAG